MFLQTFRSGGCRSHVIGSLSAGVAAVIDPKRECVTDILACVDQADLRLIYAIDTHTHADHISATRLLADITGASVVMSRFAPAPFVDRRVSNGDVLSLGELDLEVIETPGHTADSICLHVDDVLFTGDTLLIGSIGRTDLPTGDAGALFDSLFKSLATLPRDIVILPGHDYSERVSSTIGKELATNPRLQVKSREEFICASMARRSPPPKLMKEAIAQNVGR